ncbi:MULTISPECIES: LysE family translocator [Stutzerimonas stutzeri group]|jgi:threonine/homoserine/homoserine lactone efflux protein|uniref:Amino acid transporter LysE n=1 Tax=Stutzerimonas stutzeri NF13 TaxID=1212548 RepID=M2V2J6_STUST|nr:MULTISPECIES: LysE family translocator [Stutzerimonas stutzeri group]WOF78397.1 LysE family translocator [Pseudomonas sp. FeN3W]EME00027.1 amino acid transporter LysE [Stutzerimonas stutzeri NF13]MBK3870759.1 LysE family translocator [Stutzerimonas frequens]MBK3881567.1 LysE family translocator [Stutzerimonas stutzeri]MBK3909096.1 LysE family translocator [Stutzerimonas frequens]
MDLYLSMVAFALASSITPGPVNLVALNCGARFGFRASARHITGATVGFTLLLLLIGLGLYELLERAPMLMRGIQWGGVAFLLYMAWRLAADDGRLEPAAAGNGPSALNGALMQWLNPKAWLASVAGMGLFAANGDVLRVWLFAGLYFVICYGSIACWAGAGAFLSRYLQEPGRVRWLNRTMALLLAGSALYLVAG